MATKRNMIECGYCNKLHVVGSRQFKSCKWLYLRHHNSILRQMIKNNEKILKEMRK